MGINEIVNSINTSGVVSEQDVRTKVAIPILNCLGYPVENRADEFPVYGFEGRRVLNAKSVDIMLFSNTEHTSHRSRNDRYWVMDNSLIAVELKKPSENIDDAQGQAQFYAMWTRALFYICSNGESIKVYKLESHLADTIICDCAIKELTTGWLNLFNSIAFEKIRNMKCPSNRKSESALYQDYCLSRISEQFISDSWYWDQRVWDFQNEDKRKDYEVDALLQNDRTLLLSHAGCGKTTCFRNLARECANNYLNGSSEFVPILLSAKFWHRAFFTIEEGIKNELKMLIPQLTEEIVKAELSRGRYLLFIDGLDECLQDRDLLLMEIKRIVDASNVKVLLSCRTDRYYGELIDFSTYHLLRLDEKQQKSISTKILGRSVDLNFYTMDRGLKALIETPLYFYMWLRYCKDNSEQPIPANMTILYDSFVVYLLRDYLIQKGNYNAEVISIGAMKKVLAELAYESLTGSNQMDIDCVISQPAYASLNYSELKKMIKQSGLIYEVDGVVDFQQFAIKEYFCALCVSYFNIDEKATFIKKYCENDEFEEIVFLLIGLISDEREQKIVLNYLEANSLPLYIKCLKKRYNFSNEYKDSITEEVCNDFFIQLHESYKTIVNTHFSKLKNHLYPWIDNRRNLKEKSSYDSKIRGSIDPKDLSVNIELCLCDDGNELDIKFASSKPKVTTVKDGKELEIPILSFTDNKRHYYFNISELYSGIDCAREVAVEILKMGIDNAIKNDQFLFEESPLMQLHYVEQALRRISPVKIKRNGCIKEHDLSFRTHSITELENIFRGIRDFTYRGRGYSDTHISFYILWYILYRNIDTEIDTTKIPFPERDVHPEPPSGWIYDYYSMENIVKWLQAYYDEIQKEYRVFIEDVFPTIKNHMGLYKVGPIQYILRVAKPPEVQKGFRSGGSLDVRWTPKEKIDECSPVITVIEAEEKNNTFEREEKYHDELEKQMQFMHRKLGGYPYVSSSVLFSVFNEKNTIRARVYQQIEDDMKNIFI